MLWRAWRGPGCCACALWLVCEGVAIRDGVGVGEGEAPREDAASRDGVATGAGVATREGVAIRTDRKAPPAEWHGPPAGTAAKRVAIGTPARW